PRASASRLVTGLIARVAPLVALLLAAPVAQARYLMAADGPGGVPTYELLGKAFTIEVPDCGHMVPHITEELDSELNKNVFVFHIHVNQDDDRCGPRIASAPRSAAASCPRSSPATARPSPTAGSSGCRPASRPRPAPR